MELILASTSEFRRSLLQTLQLPFITKAPDVDETPLADESPEQLVNRLATLKAQDIADKNPGAIVIGSDQVAIFDNRILGKPHTYENAIKQLNDFSGQHVRFLTGLCVINTQTGSSETIVEPFSVYFRPLSEAQIHHYVMAEKPYNCAGSFKSEGLGISLFEKLEGDDPNTLIGLPLIRLVELLGNAGVEVLA
ncbi:MAG: septum formation protein [Alteromonadaceae bacterium]|jgi:septum formation protein